MRNQHGTAGARKHEIVFEAYIQSASADVFLR